MHQIVLIELFYIVFGCDMQELDVSWFMVNKMFGDEPNVLPENFKDDCLTLADIEDDLIICLPQPTSSKEEGAGYFMLYCFK